MNELELLQQTLVGAEETISGIILEEEETELSLLELIKAEQDARDTVRRINAEISAKRARRAELKNEERLARNSKAAHEVKLKQHVDTTIKEESKLANFERLTKFAKDKDFLWAGDGKAMPHQWQGALQLAHYGNAMLADTMGLGKTLQSLMYLDLVSCGYETPGAKKVLIICPDGMVTNFINEIQDWAPHRKNIIPLSGATATTRGFAKMVTEKAESFVIVSNYNAIYNSDMGWLSKVEFDAVLIDEAHNMKDVNSSTFEAINSLTYKNILPITATFILNKPQDLFAPLHLILPDIFEFERAFLDAYCEQGFDNKWTFKKGGESALMRNLGGRIVKRDMSEAGVGLPEPVRNDILIPMSDMSPEQFDAYRQITNYSEVMYEGGSYGIESVIALITRQRQAACYPAGITIKVTKAMYEQHMMMGMPCKPEGTILFQVPETVGSIKIDVATERLKRIVEMGKRGVVFSQFKTALVALEKRLLAEGIRVVRYDGDTKKELKVSIKEDFIRRAGKTEHVYDVVLCNYKAGGVGLTFTGATYFLSLDKEWNPAKNDQAEGRTFRIGQTESVLIESLSIDSMRGEDGRVTVPSIDLWMNELNLLKTNIIEGFESSVNETNMAESYRNFLGMNSKKELPVAKETLDIDDLLAGF